MEFDILVTGAGPAGLCLARALRGSGLRVALVDTQAREALADAAFDGREIALTHHSRAILQRLGIWDRIPDEHIAPLRDALVMNGAPGPAQTRMRIGHEHGGEPQLGFLVGNWQIRRAAFAAAMAAADADGRPPELFDACQMVRVGTAGPDSSWAEAELKDGRHLRARLLVAADSRHSLTRRAMGIAADLHDYGRSMLLCAMTHEQPHDHAAWEWFDHGQTLALLPMNPCPVSGRPRASVVLTLPHRDVEALAALSEAEFEQAIGARFSHQLGPMRLASTRHVYPLVGVWPRRLVAPRFAAVGDAAVGMHPVTAHGFNLGLRSIDALSEGILRARQRGLDIADATMLRRYERTHQSTSRGLFMATHAVATLYTREDPVARLLRRTMLGLGERLTPFKRVVAASLTGIA
ncbi:MAG: 5-demethoxyubiquinol-8 5-hydroxylase UbiM [Hydrogenophaga sp.]|uniref:5-demethoxyubiquinol-8 5-hydroxylase UbiM n=1 Tax=Hydrogenophaga sp. TaxID=1904254 RepID=UPI002618AD70|nr:5-demethoxyubiquinol-8 5-hydroxylase UbiM [Hydrogenophaga sp.]MDD3785827.1 5-demethoxyubiquinol-8 5-hydroxylase UbiM [Hydrogenophaga sp.]